MPSDIPWKQIKAMSFDIFGTLVDWEGGMWAGVKESAIGPHVHDRAQVLALLSKHDNAVQEEFPAMLQRLVIAEGLMRTAKELDLVKNGSITEPELKLTALEYGNKIAEYKAFPDTVEAINRLSKHFKLFPLTNVDNWSFREGTLKNALKDCHFTDSYTAEDIGSYKPSLKNFQYLVDKLEAYDIKPDQLCHTAQSLYHDHRPAKDFGLPYHVWVDRRGLLGNVSEAEYQSYDINLKVNTLKELADIVDAALA